MPTHFYRSHRVEVTEAPEFWDADIYYGTKTTNLYGWVRAAKSQFPSEEDFSPRWRVVVDEKIADDQGRIEMRHAQGARQ